MNFSIIFEEMNTKIWGQETPYNTEQWKINSNSDKTYIDGSDTLTVGNNEFNPLKCIPYDRDWIKYPQSLK